MEGVHLALGLAHFGGRQKRLADGLSTDFEGKPKIGTMSGLIGEMAVAVGFAAAPLNGGDRAAAEIPQIQELSQECGALLLQAGERVGHKVPPYS